MICILFWIRESGARLAVAAAGERLSLCVSTKAERSASTGLGMGSRTSSLYTLLQYSHSG